MKKILILFYFITLFSFSQEKKVPQDSIDYYLELASFNAEDKLQTEKAIKYTNKAISFAKNIKNELKLHDSYYFLGTIYYQNNKFEDAIFYFIRCTNFYQSNKLITAKLAKSYYSLGLCYLAKNKINLANTYFNKSYDIYNNLNISDALQLVELQKGLSLKAAKKYDEALSIFKRIGTQNADYENAKLEAYFQVSAIYSIQKKYSHAYSAIKKAFDIAEKNNNSLAKNKILNQLIFLAEKNDDFKSANQYLKKIIQQKDKPLSSNEEYILDKKDYDNQLDLVEKLEREKKDQIKSIRFSRLISILSIALISILSLLSFSLYKNNKIRNNTYRLLQEKNKELTEQKEKAEQASKARAEFLSTVSHELRTPLNAINGITYLLLQEKPKVSQLNYLKSLEFSGNYLLNFINDILEINRLESNTVQVEKINFNIIELIANIKQSFNEFIQKNNVNFQTEIDLEGNEYLIGDPTKLSQILINLINNAIKFTKNGDVLLKIGTTKTDDKNITLSFVIKDTGIGIPDDKIANIFDSFTQGSVEINRTFGGTGLGLSIVKKIIELLGSDIKLESIQGKGSTFSFDLVFEKSPLLENETIKSKEENNLDCLKDKKVLLVEDNKINQMITKKMVENKGMICTIIDNGEDAITEMAKNDYDLVLMDVHLPGINGTEATEQIRTFNNHTPIIALTAISLNENREMLLSFGMNDVITKPFEPEHFYKVIASYLTNN
ncbi:Probable hybrid two-component system sensor histidine kinase and response regulator receiver [Flavobacterium indicum GPTSA100-9 = DSM 17447]|uniref:histidine kinase n=1 Tax=Flavobacterium indicum (strain DSM 17447 / CIP 109464 / GPTSA100-9) TaxID=1094466 RepID=H8XVU4_FLAIG|nr:response regulator [Flavobacterium indicum]CCG54058.1 Probable hybrid two-component system sensor histidine kinase and response regulator receiver [Flavobacterium indicum GPTSA100-9 = DSM 17447]